MEEYIGLDVSMKETAVSVRRAGERIWRGKCASDPSVVAELIRNRGSESPLNQSHRQWNLVAVPR